MDASFWATMISEKKWVLSNTQPMSGTLGRPSVSTYAKPTGGSLVTGGSRPAG
jgi:hypothetical protein